jgi:XRE family transcriptional regulator of biofilm formation
LKEKLNGMALADQLRKYRNMQGLSMAELARRAQVSRGYISQLEKDEDVIHPSVDVLYRIALALGTSVGELVEKQIMSNEDELTEVPEELRQLAVTEQLPDEDIKMLARIKYRGHQPKTVKDWSYLYQSIQRIIRLEDE